MKLKKIASLMLAGVMAVSMLAGCSGKGETKPEEPATGVNATTVIAALEKAEIENVTFESSSTLQATADKAMSYASDKVVGKEFNVTLLKQIDTKISSSKLPTVVVKKGNSDSGTDDKAVQSYTFVVNTDDSVYGANESVIINALANKIAGQKVTADKIKMNEKLPEESGKLSDNGDDYKYTFAYKADVAVTSSTNADGQVTYYAVVTLTRTPSRVAVKA